MARNRSHNSSGDFRNTPRGKRSVLSTLIAIIIVLTISGIRYFNDPAPPAEISEPVEIQPSSTGEWPTYVARVVRVVDGDTLLVESSGRKERVRLLKVDTAESVHPDETQNTAEGKLASEFTKRMLEGRQVTLQYDPDEPFDTHGRRLAYVFVEGENFNVRLVREGWSEYAVKYGRSKLYDAEFREAERLRLKR